MTDTEINIAIAQACGWRGMPCTSGGQPAFVAKTPEGDTLWRAESGRTAEEAIGRNCPNYLTDPTAALELVDALGKDEWLFTASTNPDGSWLAGFHGPSFHCASATGPHAFARAVVLAYCKVKGIEV